MESQSDIVRLCEDRSLEWKQIQILLGSPTAQSLNIDQFLLFELDPDQEQSSTLVLRTFTGKAPEESLVFVDGDLRQYLYQQSRVWFIPNICDPACQQAPIGAYVAQLKGKSVLVARIDSEDRLWGFLVGYSKEQRSIKASELSLFSLLASYVALCLENVRLRNQSTFFSSESLSLETVSSALVENKSLDAILALIIDEAVRLLNAQDALVLLLEDGNEWFQILERVGPDVADLARGRLSVKNSLNGQVILTGKPLVSQDAQTDPRANHARATRLNVRSVAIAPLKIRERTIGTIAVHNKCDGYFSQIDIKVLCSFANQAAIAIDNAQLFSQLLTAHDIIQQKADELQELLGQTISIQEDERRRIASDIHDRVVSRIVGALYEVEGCVQLYNRSQNLDEKLQLLKQLLNEASEKTRESIYNLWPATLDHIGLIPALRELFKHQEARTGLHHRMHVHGAPYELSAATQIAIYRIVQEASNNAFQHGAASSVDLSFRYDPGQVKITVRDDGHGFDVQSMMLLPLDRHFGLIGMRERALSVGGKLQINSEPSKGSQVILEIPYSEEMQVEGLMDYDGSSFNS